MPRLNWYLEKTLIKRPLIKVRAGLDKEMGLGALGAAPTWAPLGPGGSSWQREAVASRQQLGLPGSPTGRESGTSTGPLSVLSLSDLLMPFMGQTLQKPEDKEDQPQQQLEKGGEEGIWVAKAAVGTPPALYGKGSLIESSQHDQGRYYSHFQKGGM